MNYSEKFKLFRKSKRISKQELANLLSIDYKIIDRIETNKINPSDSLINKFNLLCHSENFSFNDNSIKIKENKDIIKDLISIIDSSFTNLNKSINYLLIQRNWCIGKRICEEIINTRQEDYGKSLVSKISKFLVKKYGSGFTIRNIYYFIDFYKMYPNILHSASANSFLSWTHYRILLQINDKVEREWYAKEASDEVWSVKVLQRNISTQYYRRILSSNNKELVHQEMVNKIKVKDTKRINYIKDPMILEFLGLDENNTYLESNLEKAIINHLQKFIMELGKGYAFVARQQRIHTEKEDYYIDLVFYNYILKCFVLIDLKTEKISYQDVGQMDMYIKIYDEYKKDKSDNPTLGIVLTSDTDEDIAKYSILHGNEQLFATKYKLYLPTEIELKDEIEHQKLIYELKK